MLLPLPNRCHRHIRDWVGARLRLLQRTFRSLPIWETLSRIAEAGDDGVELDPRTIEGVDAARLAVKCQELGLSVAGLHWLLAGKKELHLTHPCAAVREGALEYLRRLTRECSRLGGEVMVLGGARNRRLLEGVTLAEGLGYAYLVHIHVNDASGAGPGMGNIDLQPMLAALRSVSYDGWISVEAFDPSPNPNTVARRSLEYLKRHW